MLNKQQEAKEKWHKSRKKRNNCGTSVTHFQSIFTANILY